MNFDVKECTILLVKSGSHAYGTNIETSDEDFKGVAIPPKEFVVGPFYNFEQKIELVSKGHPADVTITSLMKTIKLASECNPNMIETLFTDRSDILVCDEFGDMLIENRDLFLSRQAKHRFTGYAHSQLKRIKGHRAWLMDPPKKKPERSDFGLPDVGGRVINSSTMGAVDELTRDGYSFSGEAMEAITLEKRYATALKHWKQYESWKKNRNPARSALEAKFGFDPKHGMHLIRLLRMGTEILSGKGVLVKRPDAEELVSIRRGARSYDDLLDEAEKLDAECGRLFDISPLPNQPSTKKLNALCVEMHCKYWDKK